MPYPYGSEDIELLSFYRKIAEIRIQNSVYANGGYRLIALCEDYLIFERFLDGNSFVTVINNSQNPIYLTFSCDFELLLSQKCFKLGADYLLDEYKAEIIKVNSLGNIVIKTFRG